MHFVVCALEAIIAVKIKQQDFVFLNNVAIGANYLINKYKYKRVAIIDIDVHHIGNGTQDIFMIIKMFYLYPLTISPLSRHRF